MPSASPDPPSVQTEAAAPRAGAVSTEPPNEEDAPSGGGRRDSASVPREGAPGALANTVAAFDLLADRLAVSPSSPLVISTLRRELHRVQGSAASIGLARAAQLAATMETLAARWMNDPDLDRDARAPIVLRFARTIEVALARRSLAPVDDETPGHVPRRLLLLDLPDTVVAGLVAEGMARGYHVERVEAAGLADQLRSEGPCAIVSREVVAADARTRLVPRVVLCERRADAARIPPSRGQRALDLLTEPREVFDALAVLEHFSSTTAGVVCLVDDDPVVRKLLKQLVTRDGFEARTFSNGRKLMDSLATVTPLVLVLDVDLPEGSGLALARRVRDEFGWEDVPILMLTGHTDIATRAAAFADGADDYMVKPIVPLEFQRRVARLAETRRRRRSLSGIDPASGLPTAARTMREIEMRLRRRRSTPETVIVVRPREQLDAAVVADAWMTECVALAQAVRKAGGTAGILDGGALGAVLSAGPWEVAELLADAYTRMPPGTPSWHAGIAAREEDAPRTTRALVDAADVACRAARDSAVASRVWNPADFDMAPDVIVVEGDDTLAEMLIFALKARSLSSQRYTNGPEALDALLLMRPQGRTPLVLLEADLPGLDGHSLQERLRMERPDVFDVFFLSAHASESEQLRALQGGALDYISKPVSLRVLMAKIVSWRSRKRTA